METKSLGNQKAHCQIPVCPLAPIITHNTVWQPQFVKGTLLYTIVISHGDPQTVLTSSQKCCKTLFLYTAGENSLILLKGEIYTAYTVGEDPPMTFTQWNCRGLRRGWKFTHDFLCESMGEFSPATNSTQKSDIVGIFQNNYFTNMHDFSSKRG